MKFENHLWRGLFIRSNTYMRGKIMHLYEKEGNFMGKKQEYDVDFILKLNERKDGGYGYHILKFILEQDIPSKNFLITPRFKEFIFFNVQYPTLRHITNIILEGGQHILGLFLYCSLLFFCSLIKLFESLRKISGFVTF